jgi:hypothetical protein
MSGTFVVIRVAGEVSFELDGADIHPQINAPEIAKTSRIAYVFMKEKWM